MLVIGSPLGPTERVWEEVGGRRRSRPGKVPAPPARKETGPSPAFKRRTFGLCFRCLAADHFVAECRGSVRCLGCLLSRHLERECFFLGSYILRKSVTDLLLAVNLNLGAEMLQYLALSSYSAETLPKAEEGRR